MRRAPSRLRARGGPAAGAGVFTRGPRGAASARPPRPPRHEWSLPRALFNPRRCRTAGSRAEGAAPAARAAARSRRPRGLPPPPPCSPQRSASSCSSPASAAPGETSPATVSGGAASGRTSLRVPAAKAGAAGSRATGAAGGEASGAVMWVRQVPPAPPRPALGARPAAARGCGSLGPGRPAGLKVTAAPVLPVVSPHGRGPPGAGPGPGRRKVPDRPRRAAAAALGPSRRCPRGGADGWRAPGVAEPPRREVPGLGGDTGAGTDTAGGRMEPPGERR